MTCSHRGSGKQNQCSDFLDTVFSAPTIFHALTGWWMYLTTLQAQHSVEPLKVAPGVECAICFGVRHSASRGASRFQVAKGPDCVRRMSRRFGLRRRLPCAPQHVFHLGCVLPWLKKVRSEAGLV